MDVAAKNLPEKDKIKVFKKCMKAKIIHLLPLINLNSNCEYIWKEISRIIFCNILFKYTLIKESLWEYLITTL